MTNSPLPYLQRIRTYYEALGYGEPYRWAELDPIPFHQPDKPVSQSRVTIVTTAAPYHPDNGDQGPGARYNGAAKFFEIYSKPIHSEPDLRISHIAIDRVHTTAEDQGSYFPLRALKHLEDLGEIGSLAPRFHGLPTNRSHRVTREVDCVELVSRCLEDSVDIALLVPNCPVCHQSVAMAACALEEAGIATVISGCAKDIVEHVGAPRFLFNDFPLGNSAGRPNDPVSQLEIARLALKLVETASKARSTEQSPFEWTGKKNWKRDYSNADLLSKADIEERRKAFDQAKKDAPAKPTRP